MTVAVYIAAGSSGTSGSAASISDTGYTWSSVAAPLGSDEHAVKAITYGNDLYLAGSGDSDIGGVLYTSTDLSTWTQRSVSWATEGIAALLYANSLYVAAGAGGKLATSSNGTTTWNERVSQFDFWDINGLAWGNNLFVAVGNNGKISTSSDGTTWAARTSNFQGEFPLNNIKGVAYGNGVFVAVGAGGQVAYSPNGTAWTLDTSLAEVFSGDDANAITFGSGSFVAVGNDGKIAVSSNGTNWDFRPNSLTGTGKNLNSIAYSNALFVAGGDGGKIIIAWDTIIWTDHASNINGNIYAVAATGLLPGGDYQTGAYLSGEGRLIIGAVNSVYPIGATFRGSGSLRAKAIGPIYAYPSVFSGEGRLRVRAIGPVHAEARFDGQGILRVRCLPERRAKRPPRVPFTDIRIINRSDLDGVWTDWLLRDGRLDESQVLANVVKVALMTDRRADAKEILPDPDSDDRRGWWGDLEAESIWEGWEVGSKNWLMTRAKIAPAGAAEGSTLVRIEAYTRAALQPLIDKNICSQIDVEVTRSERQRIDVLVTIYRGPKEEIELRFQGLWDEITGT